MIARIEELLRNNRSFVEQQLEPLARRELAFAVLRSDAFLAAAEPRLRALLFELLDDVVHGVSESP